VNLGSRLGFLWFVVDALAAFRVTRFITADTLAEPFRHAVLGAKPDGSGTTARRRYWFDFIGCPWCVGQHVAVGVVVLTVFVARWWQYGALALAFSAVAGLLAEWSS
jgi:hypothetical protein